MAYTLLESALEFRPQKAEFAMGKRTFKKVKTRLKAAKYRYLNAGERAMHRETKPRKRQPRAPDEAFAYGVGQRIKKDIGGGLRRMNPFRKK